MKSKSGSLKNISLCIESYIDKNFTIPFLNGVNSFSPKLKSLTLRFMSFSQINPVAQVQLKSLKSLKTLSLCYTRVNLEIMDLISRTLVNLRNLYLLEQIYS